MCLAVPVKVIEIDGQTAIVDADGVRRKANVTFVPDAAPGDYVLMHAGFAIQKWTEKDVSEFRAIMDEMRALDG